MTWDTVNVLTISWAGKIAWKLVGKILNVLEMYQVGKCWVHCPFPCDVLVMYQLGTPPLAPSVHLGKPPFGFANNLRSQTPILLYHIPVLDRDQQTWRRYHIIKLLNLPPRPHWPLQDIDL